jgi:hypothetical protein
MEEHIGSSSSRLLFLPFFRGMTEADSSKAAIFEQTATIFG